jgi:hypothetical protein
MFSHRIARALLGLAPEESRRIQRPLPEWTLPPEVRELPRHQRHPEAGGFVVEDLEAPAPERVTITPLDAAAGAALAAEAKRLAETSGFSLRSDSAMLAPHGQTNDTPEELRNHPETLLRALPDSDRQDIGPADRAGDVDGARHRRQR